MSKRLALIVISAFLVLVIIALFSGLGFQNVMGASGVAFVAYCWLNGKSVGKTATEAGVKIGTTKTHSPPFENYHHVFPEADPDNPPMRERAVFLYKRPRGQGDIKTGGTSWLGGLPALGDVQWPCDTAERPMHHVMQIDLSDAAPFLNVRGLPMHGSLAVFVSLGEDKQQLETKVCYVKEPRGETARPNTLSPVGNHTFGGLSIQATDPEARKLLPRWTVDLVQLTLEDDIDPEDDQTLREKLSAVRPLARRWV